MISSRKKQTKGPINKCTLVHFFSCLKKQQFFAPSTLGCVYNAINNNYQTLTSKKMQRLMVINTLMKNKKKHHVANKANRFTTIHLWDLLKESGLMDYSRIDHLESKNVDYLESMVLSVASKP